MTEQPTIFAVDDDQATRESVQAIAVAKGFAVQTFASAEDFLAAQPSCARGCVITDYKMSGMTGLELQKALASQASLLPVIIVSGHANIPVAVEAMSNGAVTLLEKPYTAPQLMRAIEDALEINLQRRLREESDQVIRARYDSLSEDQKQVLWMLINGAANKVVASKLVMGLRTVERRKREILKVMEVSTIAQVARMLAQLENAARRAS